MVYRNPSSQPRKYLLKVAAATGASAVLGVGACSVVPDVVPCSGFCSRDASSYNDGYNGFMVVNPEHGSDANESQVSDGSMSEPEAGPDGGDGSMSQPEAAPAASLDAATDAWSDGAAEAGQD
jgi:hypothetical protein